MAELEGRVVVVTGGGSGIGLATAARIIAKGGRPVITGRDQERGAKAVAELGEENAWFIQHDVASEDDWTRVVAEVLEQEGTVDGLVNNAGQSTFAPVHVETLEHFNDVLATNLTGAFLGMRTVIPVMIERGRGSIVNVSSAGGLVGLPTTGSYAASKWGLRGLTKIAALELAKREIRVNSVHPGMIYTPMTAESAGLVEGAGNYPACAMERVGTADEVAGAIAYLLSDEASYTTGAELAVDGSWTAGLLPKVLLGPEVEAQML
jgi:3alpha(or 20beta)-hydroxysteroid dehydrogenase